MFLSKTLNVHLQGYFENNLTKSNEFPRPCPYNLQVDHQSMRWDGEKNSSRAKEKPRLISVQGFYQKAVTGGLQSVTWAQTAGYSGYTVL